MTWRASATLAAMGLAVALAVARFQPFPGYLDSDYYYAGGMQLALGKGFSEPYLWNYLDNPEGVPHPSHAYWMPLASMIAAGGMWLTGRVNYDTGRLGFLALAAAVPVVTAALAYALSQRRELALVSGLLAVFSIYYIPFVAVSDNYGAFLVLGGLFFLTMGWRRNASHSVRGLLAGTMSLARSDGLLWLGLAGVVALFDLGPPEPVPFSEPRGPDRGALGVRRYSRAVARLGLTVGGFLVVMAPWFVRNYLVHGTVLAPGGEHLFWLTTYDDTFAYPASQLTYARWVSQGLPAIMSARLGALRWNLLNAFAAQGGVFMFPFIVIGAWNHRHDARIQVGLLAWLSLLFTMTLIFPFAGSRGGFFHAGAGLQGLWWTLAPLGLEAVVLGARKRNLFTPHAFTVFSAALVGIAVLMSAVIFCIRVLPGWGEGEQTYPKIEEFLKRSGARTGEILMVRNPPGYYVMTGRPAIAVPYADASSILAAARRYDARYLVLEAVGAAGPIKEVYEGKSGRGFELLGELDGTRIFRVGP